MEDGLPKSRGVLPQVIVDVCTFLIWSNFIWVINARLLTSWSRL